MRAEAEAEEWEDVPAVIQAEMTVAWARTAGPEILRGSSLGPALETESARFAEGGVAVTGKANSRRVPVLCHLFPPVPGRADETQGRPGTAHQLHAEEHEDR